MIDQKYMKAYKVGKKGDKRLNKHDRKKAKIARKARQNRHQIFI